MLWEAETPATCGRLKCSGGPTETQHRGGSLKDLAVVRSVPEGTESERTLSGGERTGG